MKLRHELNLFDDHTFYLIQEVPDDERSKERIDIMSAHVYKTIYGAFMAHQNLGVNANNRKKNTLFIIAILIVGMSWSLIILKMKMHGIPER